LTAKAKATATATAIAIASAILGYVAMKTLMDPF
jgi:hypothetical protein